MRVFLILVICLSGQAICISQTAHYNVIYTPHQITYNGSDDPSECWESVEWGLEVSHDKGILFFSLPFSVYKELEQKLTGKMVTLTVVFYEEPDYQSGSNGRVIKIEFEEITFYSER